MFSKRTAWNLGLNPLARCLQKRRDRALPILDLTASNPTRCGIIYPEEDIQAALSAAPIMSYQPDPKGLAAARAAIAAYYQDKDELIDAEDLILTASSSEAYSFLFRLLTNPGDEVLVPQPSYPLFDFLADINDVALNRYPLRRQESWRIDRDAMMNAMEAKTRAILAVSPNNPTGSYLHVDDRAFLLEVCEKRDMALIVDEVFFDCALDASAIPPPWSEHSNTLVFRLNGLSKMLGLPQLKLGWIYLNGPSPLRETALARLEVIADTFLSVSTPIQRALPSLLNLRKRIQNAIYQRITLNWTYLIQVMGRHPEPKRLPVQGGWYATLEFPQTHSDEEWSLRFLEADGVYTFPGYFFDYAEPSLIVLSLLTPTAVFQDGISKMIGLLK